MKKARTKKTRGLKRKSPQPSAKKSVQPTNANQTNNADQTTKVTARQETRPGKKKSSPPPEPRAHQPKNNVLKVGHAPQNAKRPKSTPQRATSESEVDRWISLIREGEFDRKVTVKGKTGALLVRG